MSTSADDSAVTLCVDGSHLEHISEEMLLDGGLVSIRRLELDDLDGVIALSETLTESERYFRFFTAYPSCLKNWARSLAERSDKQFALGAFESGRLIGSCATNPDAPRWRSSLPTKNICEAWAPYYLADLDKSRATTD